MTDSQKWMVLVGVLFFGALVYLLSPVLIPFLIATLLAYFFNPLVDRLMKLHLPRLLVVTIVFIVILLIIFGLIFLIVPVIEKQITHLIDRLPAINAWFSTTLWPWLEGHFHIQEKLSLDSIIQTISKHLKASTDVVATTTSMITTSGFALVEFFTSLVLIPVVMFYMLRDWDNVTKAASKLLPRKSEKKVIRMLHESGDVLAAFFRGQVLVMIGLGIIYSLGLWMIGLEVGILIGILAGLLSIVPYLGFISGLAMALLAAFFQFHDWSHVFLVIIVFCVGEMAESFVLIPWLVGNRVKLHPIAVIFAILAFGQLFGFVGVLIAVPVTAVIIVFLRHLFGYYTDSKYYREIHA